MIKKEKINNNKNSKVSKIKRALIIRYFLGFVALVATIGLVYRGRFHPETPLSTGQIAAKEIRAQIDFSYVDEKETQLLKEQAVALVSSVYYIDPKIKEETVANIERLFDAIKEINKEKISLNAKVKQLKEIFPWIDSITLKILLKSSDLNQVKNSSITLASELSDKGIMSSTGKIKIISSGRDSIRLKNTDTEDIRGVSLDKFLLYNELDSTLENRLRSLHPFDRRLRQAMKSILLKKLNSNVIFDVQVVKQQKEEAKGAVEPVFRYVKRGQTIIRRGDPVTALHQIQLKAQEEKLREILPKHGQWRNISGSVLLVGILFFLLTIYLHYHQPEIFSCNKHLFLLILISLSTLALSRLMTYIPTNIDKPFWQFFIIVPICAMLVAILMDKELAIMISVTLSILVTVLGGKTLLYTVVVLFGSIVAVQSTTKILHRWEFIKAGILVGLAHMIAILMVNLLKFYSPEYFSWRTFLYQELGGFTSGLGCAMVVSICLPVLERTFNITTDIQLLELSDLNHPLLKMLITKAPGTYHHGIVVSNMAEDAAAAVGANSLLAKVASYFHDIGKITKPEYYAENAWFEEKSRHEKLLPTMSNLVIIAHVKEGIQLARRYKLPKAIADIIEEHHGNSLVYYFYKQAEEASNIEGTKIEEADFRYPGPKPQTKESGIILLADAVEAASKALVKPTPIKIELLVKDIIEQKLLDGQLDECGLTLKDINIIKARFSHILTGILHTRVEYPDSKPR